MRSWVWHALFGLILIGSLAARATATDVLDEDGNFENAIIRVAEAHGLIFQGYTSVTDAKIRAAAFTAPDCPGPICVLLLAATFEQEPIIQSAHGPDEILRYVYMDRSWDEPHRLAVFFERTKYAALAAFGLTRYVPSWHLLLIQSPPECHFVDTVDWRPVWDRSYLSAIQRAKKADAGRSWRRG
jgi:hypothetical protein